MSMRASVDPLGAGLQGEVAPQVEAEQTPHLRPPMQRQVQVGCTPSSVAAWARPRRGSCSTRRLRSNSMTPIAGARLRPVRVTGRRARACGSLTRTSRFRIISTNRQFN